MASDRLRVMGQTPSACIRMRAPAAVKVRVDDPALLPDLVSVLLGRVDTVVTRAGYDLLEVSLLGSRNPEADIAELEARLEAWGRGASVDEELG
jgi:hypothetical protein